MCGKENIEYTYWWKCGKCGQVIRTKDEEKPSFCCTAPFLQSTSGICGGEYDRLYMLKKEKDGKKVD
jgi:hypothetical protein